MKYPVIVPPVAEMALCATCMFGDFEGKDGLGEATDTEFGPIGKPAGILLLLDSAKSEIGDIWRVQCEVWEEKGM